MTSMQHGGNIYTEQTNAPDLLDFSANINPFGVPESVKQAIFAAIPTLVHYPDPQQTALTQAIATHHALQPEQIVCGNGGADVLFRALQCLHPKRALLPVPSFLEYETALQEIGCSVIYWQMSPNLTITDVILPELQTGQYDCLMLCNPNNPTGTLLQKSQLLPILDCCLQNGIRVILDECFCDMTSEAQQASLLASCTAYPNVFFLKSLTKRFAIPGLRLGYGVCADTALIKKVRQTGQPWSVNTLAAAAGIAALQDTAYQQQFQTFLEQEQPAFYHALQAIPTLQVWKPAANFIFFRAACTDLQERLLHRHILIRHCENYVGLDATYYRTAIRSHAENQILLQALKACL